MKARGELNLRINFSIPMMGATEEILRVKREFQRPLLNFIGVKNFLDGTPTGHKGHMLAHYTDRLFDTKVLMTVLGGRIVHEGQTPIKIDLSEGKGTELIHAQSHCSVHRHRHP